MVIVEHNFPFVLSIADEIVVLADGEVIASGAPARLPATRSYAESTSAKWGRTRRG